MIKLKINEKNLIANLSNAFTSKVNLFTEMAQNARRAGADKVSFTLDEAARTLIIEDNGSGIKDFQNLFTIAESGWSKETINQENPFGMGFLIAIYLSDYLEVESLGKKLGSTKADILEGQEIKTQASPLVKGTKITLKGVSPEVFQVDYKAALQGFAINVEVNGKSLERNFSEQVLSSDATYQKIDFWFGSFYTYAESCLKKPTTLNLYFQGLPLKGNFRWGRNEIVHLKESEFKVRMPDRDCLLDQDDQEKRILASIHEWQVKEIKKHSSDYEWLVANFAVVHAHDQLELFNPFDKIPGSFIEQVTEDIAHNSCNDEHHGQAIYAAGGEFSKKELMNKRIVSPVDWDFEIWSKSNDFSLFLYLHRTDALIISDLVPRTHWLYTLCTDKETLEESLSVRVSNLRSPQVALDVYSDESEIKMCDDFTLEGKFGSITVTDTALTLMLDSKYVTLFPKDETDGRIITQICSFNGEYSYDEGTESDYYDRLTNWLRQERSAGSPDLVLSEFLSRLAKDVPTLKGKAFKLSFNEEGEVEVKYL